MLRTLYEATDGENWTRSDGWLEGVDLSGWHGLETDSVGRVSGLDLSANGLSGELPMTARSCPKCGRHST